MGCSLQAWVCKVGSSLAEDRQVPGQGTRAVLGGCHTRMGCSLQAWVCKVGRAWAYHQVQRDMGGDQGPLHRGWELQPGATGAAAGGTPMLNPNNPTGGHFGNG